MEITLKILESKGFAITQEDGKTTGKMTFSIAGTALLIIDHTEVVPEYQGKDIGKQMLLKIVAMAREKDSEILPLCPFSAAMFRKIDSIKDVLK